MGFGSVRRRGPVFVSDGRCRPAAKRIPLTRKGLPGSAVRFRTLFTCLVRGPIVVRLRAELDGDKVVRGYLAVRRASRPIAFAWLRGNHSRIWASPACSQSS